MMYWRITISLPKSAFGKRAVEEETVHDHPYTNHWVFGATVMQEHEDLLRPVRFVSKVFKDAELNYTRSEKEVLALLKALDQCVSHLWAAMLSPWNLTIIRKENVTEALAGLGAASVTPMEEFDAVLEEISRRKAMALEDVEEIDLKEIQEERLRRVAVAQREDPWLRKLIKVMEGDLCDLSKKDVRILAKASLLYVLGRCEAVYFHPYKGDLQFDYHMRLVIPERLREDVVAANHVELGAGAHMGVSKTFAKMRKKYHWKGMFKDIVEFVGSCVDYNTGRGKPPFAGRSPGNLVPSRPFQVVAMDFAIPLPVTHAGNQALLLFTCLFSGFVILVPMNSTTAEEVASVYLENVFKHFGAQEMVRHDRDPRFTSSVFKTFNRMLKQRQRPTLAYRPQATRGSRMRRKYLVKWKGYDDPHASVN
ncbi:TPA: hypothetical protein N0F65_012301 [Lagenidium giganteum]|uniref:Integrase catalytic domain-containing protein n=1 Tax=Lagenidium giganteum TaxID=4803 RepID=A0AAV2ZCG6_9STRA|nr:TPA: hypothetical protein N0F65_012301 [Lagenidium giganteum]